MRIAYLTQSYPPMISGAAISAQQTAEAVAQRGHQVLEAAASGLPIVAVNATCISEIVYDRSNGFLVKPGDINAFSKALITLLNSPKRPCAMGLNGRMLADGHDIQTTWALHENLYREM